MQNPWQRLKDKSYKRLDRVFEDAEMLTPEECYRHPLIFLYISKIFVRKHTEDWSRPYGTGPIITRLIGNSFCFSLCWGTFFTVLLSGFVGYWVEGWLLWIQYVLGVIGGGIRFYHPLIREEIGLLNWNLDQLQAIEKIKRSARNGALNGLRESHGAKYFQHEYFHQN